MADVVVEHRIPVVLSVKHFSGGERARFVTDFAVRLFQRSAQPLHVYFEEAHELAPQRPYKGEEAMLGAIRRLWKLGRSSGLGGSAITQRPASLSKNITTQAEVLVVHRTLGPQDVAAIRAWIRYHGEREDILAQLATLKTGEAYVWAPDFPEGRPIGLRRIQVLPQAGERVAEPKALAPVDLERLRTRMAATLQKARAEDPGALRQRVKQLEAELARARAEKPAPPAKTVEVHVLNDVQLGRLEKALGQFHAVADRFDLIADKAAGLRDQAKSVAAEIAGALRARQAAPPTPAQGQPRPPLAPRQLDAGSAQRRTDAPTETATLSHSTHPAPACCRRWPGGAPPAWSSPRVTRSPSSPATRSTATSTTRWGPCAPKASWTTRPAALRRSRRRARQPRGRRRRCRPGTRS
ncbi:MAG: hypothetical protein ACREVS_09565 [Burkholderiales bacterium]